MNFAKAHKDPVNAENASNATLHTTWQVEPPWWLTGQAGMDGTGIHPLTAILAWFRHSVALESLTAKGVVHLGQKASNVFIVC